MSFCLLQASPNHIHQPIFPGNSSSFSWETQRGFMTYLLMTITSQNMRNGEAGYFACFWFVCEFACSFFLLSVCLFFSNVDMHLHNVYLHCPWKPVCKQRGSHAIANEKIHKSKKLEEYLTQFTNKVAEFSCW